MKKCKILDINSCLLSYDLQRDLNLKLDKNSAGDLPPKVELETTEDGYMIAKGLPCAILDRVNLNNTIFTTQLLNNIIDFNKRHNFFKSQKMISALDHPATEDTPKFKNGEVSHAITNLYYKDLNDLRVLFCDAIVYSSSEGLNLQSYLQAKANLGLSIRGFIYDYNELDNGVREFTDYEILGIDIVTNPSNLTLLNMKYTSDELAENKFGDKNLYDKNSRNEDRKTFSDGSYVLVENPDNGSGTYILKVYDPEGFLVGSFEISKMKYQYVDFMAQLNNAKDVKSILAFLKKETQKIKEDKNATTAQSVGAISQMQIPVSVASPFDLKKVKVNKNKEINKSNSATVFKRFKIMRGR